MNRNKLKTNTVSKIVICFVLLFFTVTVRGQDIITKNDKTEVKVKLIEITEDAIKYHDWTNQSGPIYTISKSNVFMITYQSGKREFVNSNENNSKTVTNNSGNSTVKGSRFSFSPRDKSLPKSETNYGDRFSNYGVTLNTFGETTVPTISAITDIIFIRNLAFSIGSMGSYNSEKIMGYSSKALTVGLLAGGTYYLNELLKLNKSKTSVYSGVALAYTHTSVSSDIPGAEGVSSGGINFLLRAGGRYHFTRKLGLFAEAQVGKGDPAFVAGLSILTFK
ncbi:hypothetical protein ACR78F_02495 [Sphingobacterium spiritivorum]